MEEEAEEVEETERFRQRVRDLLTRHKAERSRFVTCTIMCNFMAFSRKAGSWPRFEGVMCFGVMMMA